MASIIEIPYIYSMRRQLGALVAGAVAGLLGFEGYLLVSCSIIKPNHFCPISVFLVISIF